MSLPACLKMVFCAFRLDQQRQYFFNRNLVGVIYSNLAGLFVKQVLFFSLLLVAAEHHLPGLLEDPPTRRLDHQLY